MTTTSQPGQAPVCCSCRHAFRDDPRLRCHAALAFASRSGDLRHMLRSGTVCECFEPRDPE